MASLYLREDLEDVEVGARLSLTGAEAKHAATVNRTRPGESVLIGNGRSLVVSGEVLVATNTELTIDVASVQRVQRAEPSITLVQALAKGDRDELAVQAATELGIDAVVPWAASRSVSRWEGQKVAKGRDRWSAIVREASKQSIRAWTPEVGELASTRQVATDRQFTQRAMLYAELEVARWLLHGRELRDQSIVDDAVQMLDGLVDRVHSQSVSALSTATGPILAVDDVEAMLDRTPGDRPEGATRSGGMRPVDDATTAER